jgi:hypothetical protein
MLIRALAGLSLLATVSLDSSVLTPAGVPPDAVSVTPQQRDAAVQPLVRSATECIVRAVEADPRLKTSIRSGDISDLIVDSVESCVDQLHDMIDAYDHYYGKGSGEAYFMGPYLDVLPAAVKKRVQAPR